MKYIKFYFRELARQFFKKWIRLYGYSFSISREMFVMNKHKEDLVKLVKETMARKLADKIIEDGLIEITEENDIRTGNINYHTKIRLI